MRARSFASAENDLRACPSSPHWIAESGRIIRFPPYQAPSPPVADRAPIRPHSPSIARAPQTRVPTQVAAFAYQPIGVPDVPKVQLIIVIHRALPLFDRALPLFRGMATQANNG